MSALLPLLLTLSLTQQPSSAPPAEYHAVCQYVVDQAQQRDLLAWARQLAAEPQPNAPAQRLIRFEVFLRTGYDDDLLATIDAIAADKDPAVADVDPLIMQLIRRKQWSAARKFVELRPTARPGWAYVLVDEMAKTMPADDLDAWLARQSVAGDGPSRQQFGDPFAYDDFWLRIRLDYRRKLNAVAELIEQLADNVRAHPDQILPVVRYWHALQTVDRSKFDTAWLADVCKPIHAYDCYYLGHLFAHQDDQLAAVFLERCLALPWTDYDQKQMQQQMRSWARIVADQSAEQIVRVWTKRELIRAYNAIGQSAKAQQLLEQLAAEHADAIPGMALLAGQVQGASGARVIEGRIREAEPANKDSYEYWRTRAQYYAGRKETDQAVAAFEKALELSKKLGPQPDGHGDANSWPASFVVGDYVQFYRRQNHIDRAVALLWRELKSADPATGYAQFIVKMLRDFDRDDQPILHADDDCLWRYLAAQPQWNYAEEMLLQRMAAHCDKQPAKRQAMWKRGEQLAGPDFDPTRSKTLGWVMTRYGAQRRAIPLLLDAIARLPHDDQGEDRRRSAQFNLFETYLDLGDWRNAEQWWDKARQQLTLHEQTDWLGDLAVAAAAAGARDDAMRIWRQRCRTDVTDLSNLDDMVDAGMRHALLKFYKELSAENPRSAGLQRIIASLK